MITKRLTLLILFFQSLFSFGQTDTIKIRSWKDLNVNGYYQVSFIHPWDSTVTFYCGIFEQNKFQGIWTKYNRGDSTKYSFSKKGILTDRSEFFKGKLFIHNYIKFDTLNSPILITKEFRLWHEKEPYNYEGRPRSIKFFKIIDSLCDYSQFDYLLSCGGDCRYFSDSSDLMTFYNGSYEYCPRDQIITQYEYFETQNNNHLIFRKEITEDSIPVIAKSEVYYYNGINEIPIAQLDSKRQIHLLLSRKKVNEIIISFPEMAWRFQDFNKKYKYKGLIMYMK
ncbi:hypothetical protein K6119_09945 [Paracrocinitomix mangrovi]|uniref:hypothetical protein n=1 Tax=Paracrocinitomix mangrovi TaxID=2862509 RepID=UPI001C8D951D|nr:hypothetical protein [Paracrocinitomix mangrovi]UKN03812.1 hypothetical protein K6119_09945 [Paracrocinitomix mangrovi]